MTDPRLTEALRRGRIAFESMMTSSCRIERPADRELNRETGKYESNDDRTVIYAGKCRLKNVGPGQESESTASNRAIVSETYDLQLPWNTTGIDVSDLVVMLDTGKRYAVVSVDDADQRNALHVKVVHRDPGIVTYG